MFYLAYKYIFFKNILFCLNNTLLIVKLSDVLNDKLNRIYFNLYCQMWASVLSYVRYIGLKNKNELNRTE